jgi:hypothetical protein
LTVGNFEVDNIVSRGKLGQTRKPSTFIECINRYIKTNKDREREREIGEPRESGVDAERTKMSQGTRLKKTHFFR